MKFANLFGIILIGASTTMFAADDPLESLNRVTFKVNKGLDKVIKPVTKAYNWVTPAPLQGMVRNFFKNLDDVPVMVNDALQGKLKQAGLDLSRFVINSTVGVMGFVDVASGLHLEKHREDLGQTFAKWGWKNPTYLVLPILGPTTSRDIIGRAIDYYAFNPQSYVGDRETRFGLFGLNYLQTRSDLLSAEKTLEAASVDEYALMRNAYLQHRAYLISDGQTEDSTTLDRLEMPN